ncbi:MAG: hypothetical protein LKI24_04810 [Acidipropionibacterium sp.]|jgi:hypothetical protein|nr:hypothetical protein [Acidipropionibacterium sp.]
MLIPEDATTVALGRQALGLAAQRARDAGRRTVLVPQYCCQTMVTPWQLEGLAVRRVDVGPDLLMDAGALSDLLSLCREAGERPVILHCETFGVRAGAALEGVLADAERAGAVVLVDRTHSFLGPRVGTVAGAAGRVEMVSTRKLLPLGELAWITGGFRDVAGRTPADEAERAPAGLAERTPADDELTAARMRFLDRPGVDTFETAEDLADDCWTPVPPHPQTLAQHREFDSELLAENIMATRKAVLESLAGLTGAAGLEGAAELEGAAGSGGANGVEVVNPGAVCPLVLRLPRAEEVAVALHRQGLDGPIHWDRPENLPGVAWPEGLLCLPAVLSPDEVGDCRRGAGVVCWVIRVAP